MLREQSQLTVCTASFQENSLFRQHSSPSQSKLLYCVPADPVLAHTHLQVITRYVAAVLMKKSNSHVLYCDSYRVRWGASLADEDTEGEQVFRYITERRHLFTAEQALLLDAA